MKLIHLSDLHIGKRVNGFSMLEDQQHILEQIITIIQDEQPDAVLIAGDVYDKSVPSAESIRLFDDFLVRLSRLDAGIFVISGNHDSPERMAFGARIMDKNAVYFSPVFDGQVVPISICDAFGTVAVYMLPFIKPSHVRRYYPDDDIESYSDALAVAIRHMGIDRSIRNVLVTHQFVTGAARCESEDIVVGGSDNVDASVFQPFDYVALGHLHNPQEIGSERIRYCGTPLKYSFSEAKSKKSVTVVEMREKGSMAVRTVLLKPQRDMCEIKGGYMEVMAKDFYRNLDTDAYMHITLTDEEDIPDAIRKLRTVYPNVMKLDYDNMRTRMNTEIADDDYYGHKTPIEYVEELYQKQNNQPMSKEQRAFASSMIGRIWGWDE